MRQAGEISLNDRMVQKKKGDEDEELSAQPSEDLDEDLLVDINDPKKAEDKKGPKARKNES